MLSVSLNKTFPSFLISFSHLILSGFLGVSVVIIHVNVQLLGSLSVTKFCEIAKNLHITPLVMLSSIRFSGLFLL